MSVPTDKIGGVWIFTQDEQESDSPLQILRNRMQHASMKGRNIVDLTWNGDNVAFITDNEELHVWRRAGDWRAYPSVQNPRTLASGPHCMAAMNDAGRVWTWGAGFFGQLGNSSPFQSAPQNFLAALEFVVQISCADSYMAARTSQGKVFVWGSGEFGRLGLGQDVPLAKTPTKVEGMPPSSMIACGKYHMLSLGVDEKVYSWGYGAYGQLGANFTCLTDPLPNLVMFPQASTVLKQVACGAFHSAALADDGQVWTWGSNSHHQLGQARLGQNAHQIQPGLMDGLSGPPSQIACGEFCTMALCPEGVVCLAGLLEVKSGKQNAPQTVRAVTLPQNPGLRLSSHGSSVFMYTAPFVIKDPKLEKKLEKQALVRDEELVKLDQQKRRVTQRLKQIDQELGDKQKQLAVLAMSPEMQTNIGVQIQVVRCKLRESALHSVTMRDLSSHMDFHERVELSNKMLEEVLADLQRLKNTHEEGSSAEAGEEEDAGLRLFFFNLLRESAKTRLALNLYSQHTMGKVFHNAKSHIEQWVYQNRAEEEAAKAAKEQPPDLDTVDHERLGVDLRPADDAPDAMDG